MKKAIFGLMIYNIISLNDINAQTCFAPAVDFSMGNSPNAIAIGDFNEDGFNDLAVTNQTSNTVSVSFGNGGGSFGGPTSYSVGLVPRSVCSADFNIDGHADLAICNGGSNNVSVLFGTGTGSFGAAVNFAVGSVPYCIISRDFNSDGKEDLAVANSGSYSVSILLSNGLGGFNSVVNYAVNTGPRSLTSLDLDGDGFLDIVTAEYAANTISYMLGTGTGTFVGGGYFSSVGNSPSSLTTADFDQNGINDFAFSNYTGNNIKVAHISSNMLYSTISTSVLNIMSIINSDFNLDGFIDIATANYSSGEISILLGDGTNNFQSALNYTVGSHPTAIASDDFDGDGSPDIAVANYSSNNISVLLNSVPPPVSVISSGGVCTGDSISLIASGANNYIWSANAGNATTSSVNVFPLGSDTYTVTGYIGSCSSIATITVAVPIIQIPEICILSADSLSINNIIYWDKAMYTGVDSFLFYRYDAFSSLYLKIGAISKDSYSMFVDTARNTGGPNGGDPQYGSWQYKMAILDTCHNVGEKSPYHQSVFIQQNLANFSWNSYAIEGQSNPVTGYQFQRDNYNTGVWQVLVNTVGLSTTDPNYLLYPDGNWRVDALGITCNPTLRLSGNNDIQTTIVRSKSNIKNNRTVGIKDGTNQDTRLKVYPNPASDLLNVEVSLLNEKEATITIENMLGQVVYAKQTTQQLNQLNISTFVSGVYFVKVSAGRGVVVEKMIIE